MSTVFEASYTKLKKLETALVDMSRRKTEIENKYAIQCGELERLKASQERLKSAIEFAHSEGFQWPSDPTAEFAERE